MKKFMYVCMYVLCAMSLYAQQGQKRQCPGTPSTRYCDVGAMLKDENNQGWNSPECIKFAAQFMQTVSPTCKKHYRGRDWQVYQRLKTRIVRLTSSGQKKQAEDLINAYSQYALSLDPNAPTVYFNEDQKKFYDSHSSNTVAFHKRSQQVEKTLDKKIEQSTQQRQDRISQLKAQLRKISDEDTSTWPAKLRELAQLFDGFQGKQEYLSDAINLVVRMSEALSEKEIPTAFVEVAFFQYAGLISPAHSKLLTQYTDKKYPWKVRYAAAVAAAEYSRYFIDKQGAKKLNVQPVGRLDFDDNQRQNILNVFQEINGFLKEDVPHYQLQKNLLHARVSRLYQADVNTLLVPKQGQDGGLQSSASGILMLSFGTMLSAQAAEATVVAGTATVVITAGGLSMYYWLESIASENRRLNYESETEEIARNLTESVESPEVVEKGEAVSLAVAVPWQSEYASYNSANVRAANRPDCEEDPNDKSSSDWAGTSKIPWWQTRFPAGPNGANMTRRTAQLRQEVNGLVARDTYRITKSESFKSFVQKADYVRPQLSSEGQKTLAELKEIERNVLSRSSKFRNSVARSDKEKVFVKAIKKDGKWQPSVEINVHTNGQPLRNILGEEIITQLQNLFCGATNSMEIFNLGNNTRIRYGEHERQKGNHFHYEKDLENYECNISINSSELPYLCDSFAN